MAVCSSLKWWGLLHLLAASLIVAVPLRVFVIVMENESAAKTMEDPIYRELMNYGQTLTNYWAIGRPSQPNYIGMLAGDTLGCVSDQNYAFEERNLVDLLEERGITWKVYMEGYPGDCDLSTSVGKYARRHNPFLSFTSVTDSAARCAHVVPAAELARDVADDDLPQFTFYAPDTDHSGHTTSTNAGARWLFLFLRPLLANPHFATNTLIVVTFDQSSFRDSNQVFALLIEPTNPGIKGTRDQAFYNHYSLLKTLQLNFGLVSLGRADEEAQPFTLVAGRPSGHTCPAPDLSPSSAWPAARGVGLALGSCTGGNQIEGEMCEMGCAPGYGLAYDSARNNSWAICRHISGDDEDPGRLDSIVMAYEFDYACVPEWCPNAPSGVAQRVPGGDVGNCRGQAHGAECSLSCAPGWTYVSGPRTATCVADAPGGPMYSFSSFVCQPATCTAPDVSQLAGVSPGNCLGPRTSGQSCTLACEDGFALASWSTGKATCVGFAEGRSRFQFDILCQPASCLTTDLSAIEGAAIGTCGNVTTGQTCQLDCARGWVFVERSGSRDASCDAYAPGLADLTFSSFTCRRAVCELPSVGHTGNTVGNCDNTKQTGETCILGCAPGYVPNPQVQATATCTGVAAGRSVFTWDSASCSPVTCPLPDLTGVDYAHVGDCINKKTGQTCMLTCLPGYVVAAGDARGHCVATAQAKAALSFGWFSCQLATCPPPDVTNAPGAVAGNCGRVPQTTGQTCQMGCGLGYSLLFGNTVATCAASTPGTAAYAFNFQCKPAICANPDPLTMPRQSSMGNCTWATTGQVCLLGCADGFSLGSGSQRAECVPTAAGAARLSFSTYTCLPVTCPPPNLASIPGAVAGTCVDKTTGQTCVLACASGYTIVGSGKAKPSLAATCVANGPGGAYYKFSAFICNPLACPNLNKRDLRVGLLPGTCVGKKTGETCELACGNGLTVRGGGSLTVTCEGVPDGGPKDKPRYNIQLVDCVEATCPPPDTMRIANGGAGNCLGLTTGSLCNMGCKDGYVVGSGDTTTMCVAVGPGMSLYTHPVYTCLPVACAPPDLRNHPRLAPGNCIGKRSGETCQLACADGLALSPTNTKGSLTATCSPAGVNAASYVFIEPTCLPVKCSAFKARMAGIERGTCSDKSTGETCEVDCGSGYIMTEGSDPTAVCKGSGPNQADYVYPGFACTAVTCTPVDVSGISDAVAGACVDQKVGQSCMLACKPGYYVAQGSPAARCVGVGPGVGSYQFGSFVCTAGCLYDYTCPAVNCKKPVCAQRSCSTGGNQPDCSVCGGAGSSSLCWAGACVPCGGVSSLCSSDCQCCSGLRCSWGRCVRPV